MVAETQRQSAQSQQGTRRFHLSLWHLLLLGLIIRVVIAPFTEHQFDMGTFKNMAIMAYSLRLNPLYYWSYGPVWLYTILAVYPIYLSIGLVFPSELLLNLIIKLPLILGDLALAAALYYLSSKVTHSEHKSKIIAAAWLFNPLVILVSSVHGMFDQLPALFALVSLIFLIDRRINLSAGTLAVAFSLKLYALFLIPFWLLPVAKVGMSKALKFLAAFLIVTFILYSPYLIDTKTIGVLVSVYLGYKGFEKFLGYPVGLANFIPYVNLPPPMLMILTNQFLALLVPALAVLILYLWKKKQLFTFDPHILNRNVAVALLLYFLFYQFVHPQFVLWVLPGLLIAYSLSKQLHGYLYHSLWLSIFIWYVSQGLETFVSGALVSNVSWSLPNLSSRLPIVSSLSNAAFVVSSILCVVSMLTWRKK